MTPRHNKAGLDWQRHHPAARRIAAAIVEHAPILRLPRWRVLQDTRQRFGCSDFLARQAYAIARKAVAG